MHHRATSGPSQAVSYKWLARERSLPANLAKQLLFAFAEAHRGKVAATYLLAGWVRDGAHGDEPRHVVKLVPAACLARCSAELDRVTDVHVHNVQPTQPMARTRLAPSTAQLELAFSALAVAKRASPAEKRTLTRKPAVQGLRLGALLQLAWLSARGSAAVLRA